MAKNITNIHQDSLQYPYRIRNWRKFQHYKFRNPPWIKLHAEILSSEDWVVLDDASKLLAVVIMLIASKYDGYLPASATPSYLRRVAYLDKSPNLKPLIECGFLVETLASASDAEQMLPNADTETETETETDKKERGALPSESPPMNGTVSKESRTTEKKTHRGHRLPEDWMPSTKGQAFAAERFGADGAAEEYENFRDYWLAVPGAKGLKLDWDRTWMKWCRSSHRGGQNGFAGSHRPKTLKERTADALQRLGSGSLREITDFGIPKLGLE